MRRLILVAVISLITAGVQGYWIPLTPDAAEFDSPSIESIKMSGEDTIFSITVPGLEAIERRNDSGDFVQLQIPDSGWLMETGSPQVPVVRKSFIVPADASVRLEIDVDRYVDLNDINVWPAQPSYKRSEDKPAFVLDSKIYNHNDLYPLEWGRISDDGWMRDFRYVTVELNPVRVNPVTGQVLAASEMTVRVISEGGWRIGNDPVFPSFHQIYGNVFPNFELLGIGQRSDPEPMLVICYDSFLTQMASFVEWKTKRGIDVTMVSSTVTGTTSAAIFSYIQTVWSTWNPKPVYIILVGDGPQLQPLTGIGSCASDSKFTLLQGGDLVPDVLISRLCAGNVTDLNSQLNKIMTYELTPPEGFGTWLDKFSGLASSEGSSPSDEEYSQEVEARFLAHNTNAIADRIYASLGHGASQISSAVNAGRFWLSYFGHGSGTSWSSPSFSNSNVDALTNGSFTPFVMDVSCDNGSFNGSSDCFAERWMKNAGKGAVGMYSSSTSTSWDEPANLAWGVAYSVTGNNSGSIPGGNCILGQMTLDGLVFMYSVFGTGSAAEEVMNQYVLFGDCSMMFRSNAYVTPTVTHLPNVPMAPADFQVTVTNGGAGIEGAVVCAFKDGEVHEVGLTGVNGIATLSIHPVTVGDMIITVSGQNLYPHESIVSVAPAGCGVVAMDRNGYNCNDTIGIMVFDSDLNTLPGTVETVIVDIDSDSNPIPESVLLTETGPDTAQFAGSIMTSATQSGSGYLRVSHDDMIVVYYDDADCDGSPVEVTDTAYADCEGPVITNLEVSEISTDFFTITWTTSEASNSVLTWGDMTPPTNVVIDDDMVTNHAIIVEGLDDCTLYYFSASSTDAGGNLTVDDNSGSYHTAITYELVVFLDANMDTNPGWTYAGQWAWGDPTGSSSDPNTGFTGSNVVGYNLNGSYTNNMSQTYCTTQTMDCSGAGEVFLSYYHWLGVESSTWDHASVQVSGNGGSSWTTIWDHEGSSVTPTTWSYSEYDISTVAAGSSNVVIRWVMGTTDSSVVYCGWNLDDVLVSYTTECTSVATPTPAPTATPDECIHDGDVSGDGSITAGDAQMAFLIALGSMIPTEEEECAADCNGDGSCTAGDAQMIFLSALGSASCVDAI
ncbi:hypothetical protein JW823_07120 [bacterium]|nr:hypothetical protein [candidate division CSSED10-310 bacterium]